jgi:hypothetical protein
MYEWLPDLANATPAAGDDNGFPGQMAVNIYDRRCKVRATAIVGLLLTGQIPLNQECRTPACYKGCNQRFLVHSEALPSCLPTGMLRIIRSSRNSKMKPNE